MKASKVRAARALLQKQKISSPTAIALAKAAAELGKGLAETLRFIINLKRAGQDQPGQRRELLRSIAAKGE